MAPKLQILIGGLDYAPYVDLESLSVDNNIVMTYDSANLTLQLDGELTRPRTGQEFIWNVVDSSTGVEINRDFGGVVVNVEETTEGPSLIYKLTVKSYEHWFNRHLVTAWFGQDIAHKTVKIMINKFCKGFTTNNVYTSSPVIIPQYFNYQKPSDCMKVIADQLEYGWYIDYWKDVHFYPAEIATSPLPGNLLDVEKDLVSYGDLVLAEDGEQVYNKIFLRGFKTRASDYMNLVFPCDSMTAQWSLGYRASSVKDDIKVAVFSSLAEYQADTSFQTTGVATRGTQLTVKKDIVEGAPNQPTGSGTAFIHYTQHLLRVPNALGTGTLPTGYVVAAHFYYLKDQIFMGQDINAQNAIAKIEGTDGVYEYSQEDKSLTNSTVNAPKAKAELMLKKYGKPQIKGSFTTFIPGWRAGQYFTLTSSRRMGGLNKIMYVHRVGKKLISSVNGSYVVQSAIEFADSPYLV